MSALQMDAIGYFDDTLKASGGVQCLAVKLLRCVIAACEVP
jgi:hypothetical protein